MSQQRKRNSNINCCVVGCENIYSSTDKSVIFYSFPNKPHEIELKEKWIAAVKRLNNYPEILEGEYVLFNYNRTVKALNMTYNLKRDVEYSSNDYVEIKTSEFLNNQYKPFAINFKRTLCDFLQTEYKSMFVKGLGTKFLPTKCPIKKGIYFASNYAPQENAFVNMPFKDLKFDLGIYYARKLVLNLIVYAKFDRDAVFRDPY